MNDVLPLSRKYRPQRFSEMVGQHIPRSILKAIAKEPKRAPRSIMLQGEYGSGKTTAARVFAKAVNCHGNTGDACNTCEACVSNENFRLEFDTSIVGNVETMRSLTDKLTYINQEGFRVVVFDECQEASRAAQGALLKTLESAPSGIFYLFCLSGKSLIPTKGGLKSLDKASIQDEVFTSKGYIQIKNVFSRGTREVYELVTKHGYSLRGTKDHGLEVFNELNGFEWKDIGEISKGDFLPIYHSFNVFEGTDHTLKECEFLGRLVGDGYYSKVVGILFNKKEYLYGEKLLLDAEITFNRYDKGSVFEYSILSRHIVKERFGLSDYTRKTKKNMPNCVYSFNREQLFSFYKGWMDADGHERKNKKRILYCSNLELLRELQVLLLGVGIVTSIKKYKTKIKKKRETVGVSIGEYDIYFLWELKWRHVPLDKDAVDILINTSEKGKVLKYEYAYGRKKFKRSPNQEMINESTSPYFDDLRGKQVFYSPVESIELIGKEEVYDIEVPIAESFIVNGMNAHNCTTNPEKILDTIKSRSIQITFNPIPDAEMELLIKRVSKEEQLVLSDGVVQLIMRRAAGHARDVLQQMELLKLLGEETYQDNTKILDAEFINLLKVSMDTEKNEERTGKIKEIISGILKYPLKVVEQDFDAFIMSLADKIFLPGKGLVGQEKQKAKEIVYLYLRYSQYLEKGRDWYLFLTAMCSLFEKAEQKKQQDNRSSRFSQRR